MKDLVLRAMRSFDESLTGPEYACNQLVVEIISDEPLTDTNELTYAFTRPITSWQEVTHGNFLPGKLLWKYVSNWFPTVFGTKVCIMFLSSGMDIHNGMLLFSQKTSTSNGAEPDWRTYVCIRIRNFSQNSCATPPGGLNCMKGNSRRFPFRNLSDASVYILILLRFFLVCL